MKVATSTIKKLTITDIDNIDPIHVMLEDDGPGAGRITITCFNQSWTNYWGSMSDRTISQFFRDCGNDYLGPKLSNVDVEVPDETEILMMAKKRFLSLGVLSRLILRRLENFTISPLIVIR